MGSEESAEIDEVRRRIRRGLHTLSPRYRKVLEYRFGIRDKGYAKRYTLTQTGRRIGVTKQRVAHIEEKALAKLKPVMGELRSYIV